MLVALIIGLVFFGLVYGYWYAPKESAEVNGVLVADAISVQLRTWGLSATRDDILKRGTFYSTIVGEEKDFRISIQSSGKGKVYVARSIYGRPVRYTWFVVNKGTVYRPGIGEFVLDIYTAPKITPADKPPKKLPLKKKAVKK